MNPNEALRVLRNAVHVHQNADPDTACDEADIKASAETIAESFAALDEWITRGGFLPKAWAKLTKVLTGTLNTSRRLASTLTANRETGV